MSRIWQNSAALAAALVFVVGCSANGANDSALANAPAAISMQANFAVYQKVVGSPAYTAALTKWSSTDLTSVYSKALSNTSNSTFYIGSHRFSNMKDIVEALKPQQQDLASNFGNQSKYWEYLGVNTSTRVSAAEYNDGLAAYDKLVSEHENGQPLSLTKEESALLSKAELVDLSLSLSAPKATLDLVNGPPPPPPQAQQPVVGTPQVNTNSVHYTNNDCGGTSVGVVVRMGGTCGGNNNAAQQPAAQPVSPASGP